MIHAAILSANFMNGLRNPKRRDYRKRPHTGRSTAVWRPKLPHQNLPHSPVNRKDKCFNSMFLEYQRALNHKICKIIWIESHMKGI